jgi:hypothetical protein
MKDIVELKRYIVINTIERVKEQDSRPNDRQPLAKEINKEQS